MGLSCRVCRHNRRQLAASMNNNCDPGVSTGDRPDVPKSWMTPGRLTTRSILHPLHGARLLGGSSSAACTYQDVLAGDGAGVRVS